MTGELGEFNEGKRIKPKPNENMAEFYIRLRGEEISNRTHIRIRTSFNALYEYLDLKGVDLTDMKSDDVLNWCRWLVTDKGIEEVSAKGYLGSVCRAITKLKKDDYIQGRGSPFEDVRKADPFDTKSGAVWPEIEYHNFVDAVSEIANPRTFSEIITMCKTGLRVAETANLDERDLNLNHPVSDITNDPRKEIATKPNTLYVDSKITEGEKYNGDIRIDTNKEKSTRIVPIDQELADVLGWYISLRPQRNGPGQPVFTKFDNINERNSTKRIQKEVRDFRQKHGWTGNMEITPHFFRHWYVTQMRNNLSMLDPDELPGTPKRVVKGLRGDSDDDVIDIYTHDWDDGLEVDLPSAEEKVREAIPKFLR